MKRFDYTVSNSEGKQTKGTLSASSEDEAVRLLKENNDLVIFLEEHQATPWFNKSFGLRLGFEERMLFTKYLSVMLKVGITVSEALAVIADQTDGKAKRAMFIDIRERIKNGQSLAGALGHYPHVFSEIFVSMIDTGEKSGTLETVLQHLEKQLEKAYELRKKVLSALLYPAVIVGMTLLISIGIVVFIMPKILDIFESFQGIALPLPTRILIGFSSFLIDTPLTALTLFLIIAGSFVALFKIKVFKPALNAVFLRVPIFGRILRDVQLARFSRTLNSLLEAGVPITDALAIISKMYTPGAFKTLLLSARDKVEQGEKLGDSLDGNPRLVPPMVIKILSLGERTGSLEAGTGHLAELYERNVDSQTKNMSVLLEPVLLVFMGLLVGGIALAIITPIYQLPNLIQSVR